MIKFNGYVNVKNTKLKFRVYVSVCVCAENPRVKLGQTCSAVCGCLLFYIFSFLLP